MTKKYELIQSDTIKVQGKTLYRIKRLSDGVIGGYIESEKNLSHEGTCFVYGSAQVYGSAKVCGSTEVSDSAKVFGSALVYGSAKVFGSAEVYGSAIVSGSAEVSDSAIVFGSALVYGSAKVFGSAEVSDSAQVYGSAKVSNPNEIVYIKGLFYLITMTRQNLVIGCRVKSYKEWLKVTKEEAVKLGLPADKYDDFRNYIIQTRKIMRKNNPHWMTARK